MFREDESRLTVSTVSTTSQMRFRFGQMLVKRAARAASLQGNRDILNDLLSLHACEQQDTAWRDCHTYSECAGCAAIFAGANLLQTTVLNALGVAKRGRTAKAPPVTKRARVDDATTAPDTPRPTRPVRVCCTCHTHLLITVNNPHMRRGHFRLCMLGVAGVMG